MLRRYGLLYTDEVVRSVSLSVWHDRKPCKKRLNWSRCRLWYGLGWAKGKLDGVQIHITEGAILRRKWPAQDMPGHVLPLIYSKRVSRGQHRYGVDAEWSVLDGGARWRNLANTINRPSAAAMLPYVKLLRPLVLLNCVETQLRWNGRLFKSLF